MSASFMRAAKRRRSSHGLHLVKVPAGIYNPSKSSSPNPQVTVEFAPNVTPVSYVEHGDAGVDYSELEMEDDGRQHFFPAAQDLGPPEAKRRRQAPNRRRSQGYVPRPANAFILFRRDFVYQKGARLPDGVEVNHNNLSKIIGSCWNSLPQAEKNHWKAKAERVRKEHIAENPGYKYQPRQPKTGGPKPPRSTKARSPTNESQEVNRKCEEVAKLLMEGKKGQDLEEALKGIDEKPEMHVNMVYPQPVRKSARKAIREQRRSSSVPLPDGAGQFFVQTWQPPHASNSSLNGNPFQFGRRRSSSVDRYLPAPSGEIVFNNPFAAPGPSTAPPRPSLSPSSSMGDLRPMDTSMFNPTFMKAAEQNTFPIATEFYHEQRLAPHELPPSPSNAYGIPIDPVLLGDHSSTQMMSEHVNNAFAPHFDMNAGSSFPSQMSMPMQPIPAGAVEGGQPHHDMFSSEDLWKSFGASKSFSMENTNMFAQYEMDSAHRGGMDQSGWYHDASSAEPDFHPHHDMSLQASSSGSSSDFNETGSFDAYDVQAI